MLTDSFHATNFSVNIGTEPIWVYPSEFGGRISNFLKLVGLEHRHITSYEDFNVVDRPVDFKYVNSILDEKRKESRDFLKSVFEYAEEGYLNANSM